MSNDDNLVSSAGVDDDVVGIDTIVDIAPRLREAAVSCARLARESSDSRSTPELEALSMMLTDSARILEGFLAIDRGDVL